MSPNMTNIQKIVVAHTIVGAEVRQEESEVRA